MNQNYITPASENTSADYTIPAFAEPITALPDTPACSASELKRRFQAPSEELRQAHNALAAAHDALDTKVEGIVAETFVGAIHETMLDEPLAAKIDAKADETSVAGRLAAEAAARTGADDALQTQISAKCEIAAGSYTGTGRGVVKTITLGYQPKAVLVANKEWGGNAYRPQMMNLAVPGAPTENVSIISTGFQVTQYFNQTEEDNDTANPYRYIAFR